MNWFTLLKQPELRTGSKVTTNLGIDSKQEDDSCERKLREYANKLGYTDGSGYRKESYVDTGIPEEIHCKALKELNAVLDFSYQVTTDGVDWESISWNYFNTKDRNGVDWGIYCEVEVSKSYANLNDNTFYVFFRLTVDLQNDHKISLRHRTEYGETLDKDNIDYAKVKEVDFR